MDVRTRLGWLLGVLSAAVALGVGELAAAFVRPAAAPVIAVGNRVITLTPQSTKNDAIQAAGTDDKLLLLGGIYVVLALLAAAAGAAAVTSLVRGLIGVAVIGGFACYCALTADAARGTDVIPSLAATAAAALTLTLLVRRTAPAAVGATDTTGTPPTASGPQPTDRRRFLQGTATAAAAAAVTGVVGRQLQHTRYDVAEARANLALPAPRVAAPLPRGVDLGRSGVPWATPSRDFYRIDRALDLPQLDPRSWNVRIHGQVENELRLTYAELLKRPQVERWITLCCVSNEVGGDLVSNARLRGALLADLLREARPRTGADQLFMRGADGMTIGAPLDIVMDGREALLAIGMNGQPLPVEHGFPVRVVVPGLYGYVSACKWLVDLEVTTFADAEAYWVDGGWAAHPPIRLASRIDRPSSGEVVPVGEAVAIAGVAWDQHVGVSAVEVQIDDGPWRRARLAAVPSSDTWRQWVLPWTPERSGSYRLRVRAVDARGQVQDAQQRPVYPSGASGYHAVTVRAVV